MQKVDWVVSTATLTTSLHGFFRGRAGTHAGPPCASHPLVARPPKRLSPAEPCQKLCRFGREHAAPAEQQEAAARLQPLLQADQKFGLDPPGGESRTQEG